MFRKLGENKAAAKLAFQVENKLKYERSNDTKKTKDGAVNSDGGLEVTLEIEAVSSRDELNKLLERSVTEGFKLEVWEIDLAGEKQADKYPAKYMQGSLSSWELPANVEDLITISTEMKIDGKPVDGYATLTEEQQKAVQYAFKDTTQEA